MTRLPFIASVLLLFNMVLTFVNPTIADDILINRINTAINSPSRSENDKIRDVNSHAAQVLDFFGLKKGMTVLDLMAGGGYYTELLSIAVGIEGKVFTQNTIMGLRMRNGAAQKAIDKRLARNRLDNTELWVYEFNDLNLDNQIDLVTLVLNFHDLYIFTGEQGVIQSLEQVIATLKPGGIIGLVDHIGLSRNDNAALHTIDPLIMENLLIRAGFVDINTSNLLRNPDDDHLLHVFDPAIRGNTDRIVIRAVKPPHQDFKLSPVFQ